MNYDTLFTIAIIVVVLGIALYFLYRWATKKMVEQDTVINQQRMTQYAFIIDKKHDKITNVSGMPKAVTDNLPARAKLIKMYFVRAKIGPQIVTLICDKHIYNSIPLKKNLKIDIAGLYIIKVHGMKTAEEMKTAAKEKKAKEKAAKKAEKNKK